MSRKLQINEAVLTELNSATNTVLNATPTGSTDTAVLRMNAAATVAGSAVTEATTAAAGTIITIAQPGLWSIDFTAAFTGAVAVQLGIGFNMAAAPIVADPVVGTDGVVKAADMLMVATSTQALDLGTTFLVTAAQAATGFTVRLLGTNSAGAAPVGIVAGSVNYRLLQLANTPF